MKTNFTIAAEKARKRAMKLIQKIIDAHKKTGESKLRFKEAEKGK